MCATVKDEKPNLILSVLRCKCPRCRRGDMFREKNPYKLKTFMKMNERCPVCGQPLDMEPGFYFGTNMVSYALAVLFSALTLVLWALTIGLSTTDSRFFWWMGINAALLVLLQPVLMRLSRAVWIVFFIPYSANWKEGDVIEPERVNKEQAGNW
ncbi:DUF983 domain-containing protein [Flavisolibacter ginsenosidimutans]|uniref:DUF983 domain-containing protein n=1 Tax=Flavisolibacter ginsenosidimutans TaxID=661481 RepID=A0A5B8UKX5_9BACT|nr:DUF983 domain-containing protein [Flavisolibacter ginsenosidimutans]QEC57208.1 DUF983 domain-containing protein [Flavisolibacter ginsenosidimutans]